MLTEHKIKIKPLSVNQAWQGRRFKSQLYTWYEEMLLGNAKKRIQGILPDYVHISDGELSLSLEFGVSNIGSDWDNPIKPFLDVLQKKYGFNDNRIYHAEVTKKKVKKGEEYIKFSIDLLQ